MYMLMRIFMVVSISRGGFIYIAESVRRDGSVKLYVGMTARPVGERVAEHLKEVETQNRRTWCGQGTAFRLLGFKWFEDRHRMEREVKKWPTCKKREIAYKWSLERARKK
ncbi:MAG TPA: hypothetical protein ENN60_03015 [archaeon]|nr:hypothetical protein [archaeon]